MTPRRFTLVPDTVLGRTALVLVAALLLSAGAGVWVFSAQRQEALESIGGRNAAERVGGLVLVAEQTPPEQRQAALQRLETSRFRVGWGIQPVVTTDETHGLAAFVRDSLEKGLDGRETRISVHPGPAGGPATGLFGRGRPPPQDAPPPPPDMAGLGPGPGPRHIIGPAIRISVRLSDESWLNVLAPLDHETLWRPRFVAPLLLGLVLVTLAALLAVRKATLPFADFASAAERLGVDVAAPPMAETGPREVRRAAHAFNVMQGRILRFVQDRTQMLAAISHDLRTPITRLRLRAEFVEDDEQRARMLADLDEMEKMIAATLAFARDDAASEPRVRLDLAAMIQGLVEDQQDLGADCRYDGPDSLVIEARPVALKRGLANLIDNAIKYGHRARLTLDAAPAEIRLTIDDDGPGIAEADRDRVFAPFVRLEASRSRDTGGTGLGLAVARAAIRAHGGDIRLANREEGGLQMRLTLPR
jgi:signal transduction histidine kinase